MVQGSARSTFRITLLFPIVDFYISPHFFLHFQNLLIAVLVIPNIWKECVFFVIQKFEVVRISRDGYAFLMSESTPWLEFGISVGDSLYLLSQIKYWNIAKQ